MVSQRVLLLCNQSDQFSNFTPRTHAQTSKSYYILYYNYTQRPVAQPGVEGRSDLNTQTGETNYENLMANVYKIYWTILRLKVDACNDVFLNVCKNQFI